MNILFLNNYKKWGGGETWMLDVADGLRERGHLCIIAGNENKEWYKRTKDLGWSPLDVNIRGEISPLELVKLYRIERKYNIDLVLCNFDKEARLASLARALRKHPVIVTMKGLPLMKGDLTCRLTYKYLVDHSVVCANFIYDDFSRFPWLDMKKFTVINNCLNTKNLISPESGGTNFRNEHNISPETKIIGAVARFVSRKGIQDLVTAAPLILKNYPDVKFVLVGDGKDKEKLINLAKDYGVLKSFIFTGFRHDLQNIFPSFDIFVLPSHYEGFPYVIQIAMFYSKPIVTTGVCGIPDAIEDGVNGLIVPPKSSDILAEKICTLLENDALRESLTQNALETLKTKLSYNRMIDEFENLFKQIMQNNLLKKS